MTSQYKFEHLVLLKGTYFPIELVICHHEILEISYAQKNLKKITEI